MLIVDVQRTLSGKHIFAIGETGKSSVEFAETLPASTGDVLTFDSRKMLGTGIEMSRSVDVRDLYDGEGSLLKLVKEVPGFAPFRMVELDSLVKANVRAAKDCGIEGVEDYRAADVVPRHILEEWMRTRVLAIDAVHRSDEWDGLFARFQARRQFIDVLREVELTRIKVDVEFVERELKKQPDTANASSLRSMLQFQRSGFVTSLFNPIGGKTGRVRPYGMFNCMSIPRQGPARQAVVSRHYGGTIYTFDFNAIDYRCIVNEIGGEVAELYRGWNDFHVRTMRFVFPEPHPDPEIEDMRRRVIKQITYTHSYGGTVDSLVKQTKLKSEVVGEILGVLDEKIPQVADFRRILHMKAQQDGFVRTPSGTVIKVARDDHPGKVLGLFAQTLSSEVFEGAFVRVNSYLKSLGHGSCIIFPLHDETVVDMHHLDDEPDVIEEIEDLMEQGTHKVKHKRGRSYGEAS